MPPKPLSEATRRFQHLWWLKGLGTSVFMTLFFQAYFHLLKFPAYPTQDVPLTWLDHALPYQTWAWPLYLSLWLYTGLPVAFLASFKSMLYYGASVGLMCVSGLLIFYFFPTTVPQDFADSMRAGQAHFLSGIDAAGNATPSLHVAAAVFSALWFAPLLRAMGAGRSLLLLNGAWCTAIVYSTLGTKQHVTVDVLAGALLGWGFAWCSLRWLPKHIKT